MPATVAGSRWKASWPSPGSRATRPSGGSEASRSPQASEDRRSWSARTTRRHRRAEQHQPCHRTRMAGGHRGGDLRAERITEDHGRPAADGRQPLGDHRRLLADRQRTPWLVAVAEPGRVHDPHPHPPGGQRTSQGHHRTAGSHQAGQQDHRGPRPASRLQRVHPQPAHRPPSAAEPGHAARRRHHPSTKHNPPNYPAGPWNHRRSLERRFFTRTDGGITPESLRAWSRGRSLR